MNDRFNIRYFNKNTKEFEYHKIGAINTKPYTDCTIYEEGQFCTGLKDKAEKLIYEGDIVNQIYEDETIYKCEIVYNNCSFQLKHIEDKNKNYINTPMYCYAINYLGHYTEKRLEVIGNIYENKELLEEYKDE